mmetsp:Transcript_6753/g.14377  ORF Transcript_6753/g.14377 Transcript_6753/m.14377 type:complete len:214 (-) Transcript_6753:559-1200(-)
MRCGSSSSFGSKKKNNNGNGCVFRSPHDKHDSNSQRQPSQTRQQLQQPLAEQIEAHRRRVTFAASTNIIVFENEEDNSNSCTTTTTTTANKKNKQRRNLRKCIIQLSAASASASASTSATDTNSSSSKMQKLPKTNTSVPYHAKHQDQHRQRSSYYGTTALQSQGRAKHQHQHQRGTSYNCTTALQSHGNFSQDTVYRHIDMHTYQNTDTHVS